LCAALEDVDGRTPPADEGVRQVPARRSSLADNGHVRRCLVAFVFPDVRGFTHNTSTHGAEAAARWPARSVFTSPGPQTVSPTSIRGWRG